jgi:UMF1 family MFS transporter
LAVGNVPGEDGSERTVFGKPVLLSWCLYDWANSAFPAVISTFVFSVYFTEHVAPSSVSGAVQWSFAVTAAGLLIAILSPVFGAVADQSGRGKIWLIVFSLICILACGLLWFVEPDAGHANRALVLYGCAATAFGLAMVFYDSMLTRLAPTGYVGRLSGMGWALGYFGGLFCLLIVLYALVEPKTALIDFDRDEGEHFRASTVFVAGWYLIFALPLFFSHIDRKEPRRPVVMLVRAGLGNLLMTVRSLPKQPALSRFLLAHLFATNGITTLILFGGVYAAGTFGFKIPEILLFAITLYVLAGLGAAVFGWLDDRIGPKAVIMIALCAIFLLTSGLVLASGKMQFWVFGTALGIFIGPAQAASRSMMARLTPPHLAAEMFGLYSLAGKITVFIGPLAFGILTDLMETQRAGFAVVLVFLAIGLMVLRSLKEPAPTRFE